MTEQSQPLIPQTVVLDDPTCVVVFADPTNGGPQRVFYDLDALFNQYAPGIMARGLMADLSGDEQAKQRVAGETLLLEGIRQSIDHLRLEADFNRPALGETD